MRDNTSSTVIWPSSCYTGVDLDLKYRARMNGISPTSGSTAIDILNNNNNNSGNSNNSGSVKAERFSPPTGDNNSTSSRSGTPVSAYEGLGGERASPMALSLSHARERDPLKAMEQATSRNYSDFMRSLAAKYNHTNPNDYFSGAPTPSTGAGALPNRSNGYTGESAGATAPVRPNALLPNRGDSSLAALQALKAGAIGAAPFLMAPLAVNAGTTGQGGSKEGGAESAKSSDSSTSGGESANRWSFGASPFATPGAPVYHPSIDMSSTQALINMVRTASAQSANQLETYLKGIKRGAENPLDLSATKKARKSGAGLSLSESLYGDALLGLPMLSALNRASKDLLPPTHRLQTKSPKPSKNHTKNNHATSPASGQNSSAATTNSSANSRVTNSPVTTNPSVTNPPLTSSPVTSRPQCMSLCADKPCAANSANGALFGVRSGTNAELAESGGSGTEMTSWTVEEVASFVGTIDICAEYAGNFRDQCIDGSALPLLTETHLTTALQMKLGPALKLRSVLSRKLGNCAVCMHCVHCHGSQASLLTGPQALLQNPQATLLTGPQALLQNSQASLLTGPQALQNSQASLLTGSQALLQNSQASLLTGSQALLQNSQASLLTGSQALLQNSQASLLTGSQALSSTPQPPPSTPSPKPLTRPNSTGN